MPWTKKATAPDYAYAPEVLRALVTGTADAWILDWLYLLQQVPTDVNQLCALGPQTCAPFSELDFLGAATSGNRIGLAINFAQLLDKLSCFANQRLFSAYCEQPSTGLVCTLIITRNCGDPTPYGTYPEWLFVRQAVPTSTPWLRITAIGHNGAGLGGVGVLNPDNSIHHDIISTGHSGVDGGGNNYWEMPWTGEYWGIHVNAGPPGSTWQLQACAPGGYVDWTPPAIEQPDSAIAPPAGDYPDVAALGRELDNIERKLHLLLEQGIAQEIATSWPLTPEELIVAPANDEDVDLEGFDGFIVTVINPGIDVDENFGTPVEFRGVGRVVLGNGSAWMPPIPITVSPLLLTNLPATITVCRVHVYVPASFSIQRLKKAAPEG